MGICYGKTAMKLHLRFLRQAGELRKALQNDGWQLAKEKNECFFANHPEVSDEPAARNRLNRIGLLTSASLSIEFLAN
jgi:hypothetical protein